MTRILRTMMAKFSRQMATKYWPQGRIGKKAALCPWLSYINTASMYVELLVVKLTVVTLPVHQLASIYR